MLWVGEDSAHPRPPRAHFSQWAPYAFPSLPFHFFQLMSRSSTPSEVTWTPWAKALWAGPAVPHPP